MDGNAMSSGDTLARWMAEEEAIRARFARAPGFARPEQAEGRSGMQLFEAMLAGEIPRPPMSETLDFLLVHVAPGIAIFQGRPQVKHYNPFRTVHGGWFATLLDSAMGCAVQTTLPAGKAYTTIEFKVNLVRPLTDAVPAVRAEGQVVHPGRQVAVAEGRLVGPDGKLYAHASTTCLVFDRVPSDTRPRGE
jgi:uncharacterized protein (TIGR00369 family)